MTSHKELAKQPIRIAYKLFSKKRLQRSGLFFTSILCFISCSNKDASEITASEFVAQLNGVALTRSELASMIPSGLSPSDSALLAERYIYSWACDQLLFDQAKWDEQTQRSIERKVEKYRRELIVYEYEKRLIQEEFSSEMGLNRIKNYISNLAEKPKATESYAQGVMLIVPSTAQNIAQIRRFAQLKAKDDVENLEKYCHQIGIIYRLFDVDWLKIEELKRPIREAGFQSEKALSTIGAKEYRENGNFLFLTLKNIIKKDDTLPDELIEGAHNEEIEKAAQINFIYEQRKKLYDQAIENRELILRK